MTFPRSRASGVAGDIASSVFNAAVERFGPEARAWLDRLPTQDNPFTIIGVSPDDPEKLVEEVYKVKARWWHPDNQYTGNEAKFKRLSNAHDQIKALQQGRRP